MRVRGVAAQLQQEASLSIPLEHLPYSRANELSSQIAVELARTNLDVWRDKWESRGDVRS